MSVDASASYNDSLFISQLPFGLSCLIDSPFSFSFTSYTLFNILFLFPICIAVLRRGWQQRHLQLSTLTSHSDSFTYHLITMDMVYIFGCVLCCCGIYMISMTTLNVGIHLFAITWFGEAFFHVLTCLEHYLAVVHPIVYLNLRKERWVRIRNVIVGCIWLLCIGGSILITLDRIAVVMMFCLLVSCLMIISFCCISVLCVLLHPGPGKQGKDQGRADQSKQRAFYTIAAILGVLVARCSWNMIWAVLMVFNIDINGCLLMMGEVWISIPSSLVLPLLFLQRAGKLAFCKNNSK